jgi:hypothetical protein
MGVSDMSPLMTISEMEMRYQRREDPFDLTIEKWHRIREYIDNETTLNCKELLQAVNIAVPFCFAYQKRYCVDCPLETVCGPGKGGRLLTIMKLIQFHRLAVLAGTALPKDTLISEVDCVVRELEMLKRKSAGKGG